MVQARKYRSQGSGGSFSPIDIGFGSVQRLEEQNKRLESTLSRNQKLAQDERAAFLNHIKNNQNLEAVNREEINKFEKESRKEVADQKFANSQQAVQDAQNEYKAITENGTVLSQLAEFSQTLGKTISEVKQSVQKKNYEDQYFKTFTELTAGDVMATRAAEANLNKTSQEFSKAAQAAEEAGVPFEYARQLERLGGSRKIAAAKALAEVTASRFPLMLRQRLAEDDQTVITYRDRFTGEEKQTTPQQATTASEVLAVSQAIMKDTLGQTGLTGVQPALIAPFLRQMNNETINQANLAQDRERKVYNQQQLENFDTDVKTEVRGNGLSSFAVRQQMNTLINIKNPETGLNFTNAQARLYIYNLIAGDARTDDAALEALENLADSPGPEGLAKKGEKYGEYYPELKQVINEVYKYRNQVNNQVEARERQQLDDQIDALAEADLDNPLSSQQYEEKKQQLLDQFGYAPERLETLIATARRRELNVNSLYQDALTRANRFELTTEYLNTLPLEIRSKEPLQQAAKLGDAKKAMSAEGLGDQKIQSQISRIYRSLVNESLFDAGKLGAFAVESEIERDVMAQAEYLTYSEGLDARSAINEALERFEKMLITASTGIHPKTKQRFIPKNHPEARAAKYYFDTETGTFPNILKDVPDYGAANKAYEDLIRRNLTVETLSNEVLIPLPQLKAMEDPNAPIGNIISAIRSRLPKKDQVLSEFDILNAQLSAAGLKPRQLPQAQVTFEAQNPTDEQKRLLNYLPTAARTTRAMADSGMNAGTEREAVRHIATRMGLDPLDVAAIIDFETANALTSGAYRSGLDQWGGVNMDGSGAGSFLGWIQFSPDNQRQYDVKTGLTAMQHAEKVVQYLTANGVQAGDPLHVVYQAIQAPAYVQKARATGRAYSADKNGSVQTHVNSIKQRRDKVRQWFGSGNVNPYADPRMQSSSSDPYGNI